jgi:hypothetical protein
VDRPDRADETITSRSVRCPLLCTEGTCATKFRTARPSTPPPPRHAPS